MVTQAIQNQIEKIDGEKKIFWILLSLSMLFIVSYGFLINRTIMNAVYKNSYEKQLSSLNDDVNDLDNKYIDLKKNITLDLALSKGFENVKNQEVAYTMAQSGEKSLSLNLR